MNELKELETLVKSPVAAARTGDVVAIDGNGVSVRTNAGTVIVKRLPGDTGTYRIGDSVTIDQARRIIGKRAKTSAPVYYV